MRDDLLDAYAAVNWADSQIPLLQQRFIAWSQTYPYEIVAETDPDTGEQLIVAYERVPFDLTINAEAGAIINAVRSSLDILAATLARRNGVIPNRKMHFPIFYSLHNFIDPLIGIEGKQWLSLAEITAIKKLKPYDGGDPLLFPLHQLDIWRKHERLIDVKPVISGFTMTMWGPGMRPDWRRVKDKTILIRLPPGHPFRPTKGNTNATVEIAFNEATLGLINDPVFVVLRKFSQRVREIVDLFDS